MLTFLFTDIPGSTHLWQQYPQEMSHAVAAHDDILRRRIPERGGRIVKSTGDGVLAVFERIADAAQAAVAIQSDLRAYPWQETGPLLVRMGLNPGDAEYRDGDYFGTAVNKAARITALAGGGQVLLSDTANALLLEGAAPEFGGRQLGAYRLKGLAGRTGVYQLLHPDLPADFLPLQGGEATPTNLPAELTSFVGREREIEQVADYLLDSEADPERRRLVTLVGPGGTGKTRLSLRAARAVRDAFPDGVWLVELAPLKEPERIPAALLLALGLQESPQTPALTLIGSYLRDRQALLIFDNCEHLIEAAARLIEQVLRAAGLVQVLASSREALGVPGETALRVPSLPVPESDAAVSGAAGWDIIRHSAAVQLFIARAESANAGRRLTAQDGQAIAEICRRLDGIPLAIEMAAARLRVFSPAQILERLDDRFRLLTGGSRTALPRQQTLQALIDWSYNLLSDEEQGLFQELSVFAGGWTLEMALSVCPERDVYACLPQLVDKSLVVAEPQGEAMRFKFLETMHQYARNRLLISGRAPEMRDRHLAYFDSFTDPGPVWSARTIEAFRVRITPEIENCRAALSWGMEADPLTALQMTANLADYWGHGPLREGIGWLDRALAAATSALPEDGSTDERVTRVLANAYRARAFLLATIGRNEASAAAAQMSIEFGKSLDEPLILVQAYMQLSITSLMIQDMPAAELAFEAGLALSASFPDKFMYAALLAGKGAATLLTGGDQQAARELLDAGLAMEPTIVSNAFGGLLSAILFERFTGNFERARSLAEAGLNNAEGSALPTSKRLLLAFQAELAHIERQSGNLDAAQSGYARLIDNFRELSMEPAVANLLECLAMIAVERGRYARAGQLFGAAEALRESIGEEMAPFERVEYGAALARLRSLAEPEASQAAWARGRALGMDQAIELAGQYAEF